MRTRSNKDYACSAGGDVERCKVAGRQRPKRKVAGRGEQNILKESVEVKLSLIINSANWIFAT